MLFAWLDEYDGLLNAVPCMGVSFLNFRDERCVSHFILTAHDSQELAALGETGSVDRVDSFLKRFSHTHASLPERMHTPVLRVNTPMVSVVCVSFIVA